MQTSGNTLISWQLIQAPDYFAFIRKWDICVKIAYLGQYFVKTSGNTLIWEHTPIPLRRGRLPPNTLVPTRINSNKFPLFSRLP